MKVLAIFDHDRLHLIISCPKHDQVINDLTGDDNEIMWQIEQMEIPDTARYKRIVQDDDYRIGFSIL